MKPILAILCAIALLQGCRGHATDSNDPGTSAGNDTITVIDRYGKDNGLNSTPGAGNKSVWTDTTGSGNTQGYDSLKGGTKGDNTTVAPQP